MEDGDQGLVDDFIEYSVEALAEIVPETSVKVPRSYCFLLTHPPLLFISIEYFRTYTVVFVGER